MYWYRRVFQTLYAFLFEKYIYEDISPVSCTFKYLFVLTIIPFEYSIRIFFPVSFTFKKISHIQKYVTFICQMLFVFHSYM